MSKLIEGYMKTMDTLTSIAHKQRERETEQFKLNMEKIMNKQLGRSKRVKK